MSRQNPNRDIGNLGNAKDNANRQLQFALALALLMSYPEKMSISTLVALSSLSSIEVAIPDDLGYRFMTPSRNNNLKSREDLLRFGFQNLVEEKSESSPSIEAEVQKLMAANKHSISEFSSRPGTDLFTFRRKTHIDGAEEIMDGVIDKNFYKDLTNKNQITTIDITITDQQKYPTHHYLLINVTFRDEKQAEKFNSVFKAKKLDIISSGTSSCAFANYASAEAGFQEFVDNKVISKTNTDFILSEIKLFMEGRNLIPNKLSALYDLD